MPPLSGQFVGVGRAEAFGPGGHFVKVEGRHVALFRLDDGFHALDNLCLHHAGPLCEGPIDGNDEVTCPWHGWSYEIRTGVLVQDPKLHVTRHDVQVIDGEVQVRLSP
ncbi:MAG TPA: Rieske (2Fe-2S) protein [Vicinamibacterales bacterium]|nr:Rieske (2Fe-2S) protein [Vicinamibacterales bacterium]